MDQFSSTDIDIEDRYRLSPAQEGMLMHTLREPTGALFFQQMVLPLRDLDADSFLEAWQRVVDRHPILRTSFHWEGVDEPIQMVHRRVELPVTHLDWRELSESERERQLKSFLRDDRQRGWVLTEPPMLRLAMIRLGERDYYVVRSHHHILIDAWSGPLVFKEVQMFNRAIRQGRDLNLPLPRPYHDYIDWLQRQDETAAEAFWREQLAGFTMPTPLPGERMVQVVSHSNERFFGQSLSLSADLTSQLESAVKRWRITLNTLIQGAWALLLSLNSGEDDVVFGVTVSGRPGDLEGIENMVGLFINVLPMRIRVEPEQSIQVWLHNIYTRHMQMQLWQHSPLVQVQGWSEVPRGTPLFETLLGFNSQSLGGERKEGRDGAGESAAIAENEPSMRPRHRANQRSTIVDRTNDPLVLTALSGEEMVLQMTADGRRFEAGTPIRLLEQLRLLLEGFAAAPSGKVGDLSLLVQGEWQRVVRDWNQTRVRYSQDHRLHRLFELQVERTPESIAVVFGSQTLSYRELNCRANQLAHALQRLGVKPDTLVGLCVERSMEMVVGLLGILKAGGAYVPLDPSYPTQRLAFLLTDTQTRVLVTQAKLVQKLPLHEAHTLCLDRDWNQIAQEDGTNPACGSVPENLAYVIYTSGSTGQPKGVMIPHRAICNHMLWMHSEGLVTAEDRVLQRTTFTFDASVWEFFAPLHTGGTLVMLQPAEHADTAVLTEAVIKHRITVLQLVPSLLRMLLEDAAVRQCNTLRRVFCGGEELTAELQKSFHECLEADLYNLYGPTEASIDATHRLCERDFLRPVVSIGRPISNTRTYVLNKWMRPVPVGVAGELFIAGSGLARGYLGRPELTAEHFVPDPFATEEGSCMYRTGDLARWMPDGQLEFLGRIDHQVKVRGFRIELGEIEAVLRHHPDVHQAVLVVTAQQQLAAYVVPAEGKAPTAAELRELAGQQLPAYMVPDLFEPLAKLPLTPSGKLDRRSLSALEAPSRDRSDMQPRTPMEKTVAQVWADVLQLEFVGANDNFFEMGGHSLLAMQAVSRLRAEIGIEVPVSVLFSTPTVAGLAGWLEVNRDNPLPDDSLSSVPAVPVEDGRREAPQSFAQQRLWFLTQLAPGSSLYNTMVMVPLGGLMDLDALERTVTELVRRHESLRTTFGARDGEPIQLVVPPMPIHLSVVDLSGLPARRRQAKLKQLRRMEMAQPFDLARGPLVRFKPIRLGERRCVLLISIHHIITDGWSNGVLQREVHQLYEAYRAGQSSPLPEPSLQYADFAIWQRQWLQGGMLEKQLGYWKRKLAGAAQLELPIDRPRPTVPRFASARQSFRVEPEVTEKLRSLIQQEEATLFMTLLAAFQVVLGLYSGQEDVVVGTPIANRSRSELENLIGFFVNTLVMRTDISGNPSFRTLLRRVRKTCLDAYSHQDLPFDMLVDELAPQRDLSVQPLFQVLFVLQNTPQAAGKTTTGQSSNASPGDVPEVAGLIYYDLTLSMTETLSGLSGALHFNTDLFDPITAQRLVIHYRNLLRSIAENPDQQLSAVSILTDQERHQLLHEWNPSSVPAPNCCIHQLVEKQSDHNAEHCAVIFEDRKLSYGELDRRANQLAHRLRALDVRPESIVAMYLERGPEAIIALLGILKAGGVYLPLDPALPPERLTLLLSDASPRVVISQKSLQTGLPECEAYVLCVDDQTEDLHRESQSRVPDEVTPEHLAYIIYTSGSTGRPKGVMIEHRSLIHTIRAQVPLFDLTPNSRVLQTIAFSFDASLGEIFRTLVAGGTLCLARREQLLPGPDLVRLLRDLRITTATLVAPVLAELPTAEELPDLRTLTVGGEALSENLAARWCGGRRLINGYGPTETTIGATLASGWDPGQKPPLGRPLPNVQAYVLNTRMQLLPRSVRGELYLGGPGLARGYFNRPDLTAERFLPDPFSNEPGARLYRTGDRVRWLPDGQLEFLGRIDEQVKVRGYRIEPEEIAAVLRQHAAVHDAVVLPRPDTTGEQRLVAYVVPVDDAGGSSKTADELVTEWQRASEAAAAGMNDAPLADPKLNFTGWTSSYTGQPIPMDEMQYWADSTVERITRLQPHEVLEIGCGTGLILFRLAPYCKRYVGTDFSAGLVERTRRNLPLLDGRGCQVEVIQRRADQLNDWPDGSFDCVVLNSVVQYFPDVDYLLRVLESALRLVRAGGKVFIGDVRNLQLLDAFHASLQLGRSAATSAPSAIAKRARRQCALERELVLAPGLFTQLLNSWPRLSHVQVLPKAGSADNELSTFRYDVVLYIEGQTQVKPECEWPTWQWDSPTVGLQWLRDALSKGPEYIGLLGIPNNRTVVDTRLLSWLESRPELRTVAELREELANAAQGVEPETLTELGRELGYSVELSWLNCDAEGRYDVLFSRQGDDVMAVFPVEAPLRQRWQEYANSPAQEAQGRNQIMELRDYLVGQLPEYMVPSAFVQLEALPLTAHGKLDRKALPAAEGEEVRTDLSGNYVAPRTTEEKVLADIWADLLRLERVGIHDNFFELGGDSILSIRVIARANEAGLKLTTQDVYRFQTVAEQAAEANRSEETAVEQGQVTGELPLTPIQHWFFEGDNPEPHHFNWASYLFAPPGLSVDDLRRVLNTLLEHHDALRLRFIRSESGTWRQILAKLDHDYELPLTVVDVSSVPIEKQHETIETRAAELQTSLNLTKGPLLRLVWFDPGSGRAGHLLAIVHHIVIDIISWTLVLGDLTTLIRQVRRGQPLQLPPKTSSFKQWVEHLHQHVRLGMPDDERNYWLDERRRSVSGLPLDHPDGINSRASVREINTLILSKEETQVLLDLARSTQCGIDELLLAALGWAVARWTDTTQVLINIERHGREDLGSGLNLSRTVGWFANITPVLLELPPGRPPDEVLQTVLRQLQSVPNRGIGYGLLKYMGDEDVKGDLRKQPEAQVFFNYFGQQRERVGQKSQGPAAKQLKTGPLLSAQGVRRHLIEINAMIQQSRVQMRWSYSVNLHETSSIEKLIHELIIALQAMLTSVRPPEPDT